MSEAKANDLIAQADKRQKAIFGGKTKFEDASELYVKAGNMLKMAKLWVQAAAAFVRAAECDLKLQSKHDAATNFINAGNCIKKTDIAEAVQYFKNAIELYTDEGRFSIAAKHQKEVAELYESEQDYENAITNYQIAADFYEGEGSTSSANSCLLKVALFCAQLEKYDKAIELYEKIAKASLDNNLLKWSVKDYYLRAGLCHLAGGDLVSAKRSLDQYQDMDPTFSSQRECKFLTDIVAAAENYDVEAFTQAVVEYDSISKLDQWKTSILLRIKNSLKNEDNGLA